MVRRYKCVQERNDVGISSVPSQRVISIAHDVMSVEART